MAHITGHDRSQILLLPESLDDYVGPENPVRFIEAFVDGLHLAAASRNVSTTLIHPGSEFKLGSVASIEKLLSGQDCRPWSWPWPFEDRTFAVRGSA